MMSLGVTVPEGECEITGSLWGGFTKNPDGSATPHDSSDSEPFTFPIPPMGESVSSPVKIFYKFFPLLTNLLQFLQDLPKY